MTIGSPARFERHPSPLHGISTRRFGFIQRAVCCLDDLLEGGLVIGGFLGHTNADGHRKRSILPSGGLHPTPVFPDVLAATQEERGGFNAAPHVIEDDERFHRRPVRKEHRKLLPAHTKHVSTLT